MALITKCTNIPSRVLTSVSRCAYSTKYDYKYWQNSVIPTMHFQKSLPRLPIPKLEKTCERYLAAQRPLLTNELYSKTETNLIDFQDSVGKHLNNLLLQKDAKNKRTSYISEPWFDMYLKDRIALPINYNPMLVFTNDPKVEYNEQSIRTTNFLISSLRFYNSLKANLLEPEVYHLNPKKSDNAQFRKYCSMAPEAFSWYIAYMLKAYPLDMSQYNNLFGTTRIPELDKDRIYNNPNSKHVCVQWKGHFYIFDVFDNYGNILPPNVLLGNIQYILNNNEKEAKYPIGIFTTMERNTWAAIRRKLSENGNEKELKLIDNALFNICLDDKEIGENIYEMTRNFMHGDGKNRWFDKSLSLQLTKDGVAGVNFEHSWGDGVAVLRYFQDIHKDSVNNPQVHPNTKASTSEVNILKLDIKLNNALKQDVTTALESYKKTCNSLDINFIVIDGLTKKLCKQNSVSPDAIMQLSFQSAYYKQYGKFVGSYESCSTAAFKHGRTETIRPCTMETKAYSEAVNLNKKLSDQELKELIVNCSVKHGNLTKEAAMGQGFDRHLFALKQIGEQINARNLIIFEDAAFQNLNHHIISTSTLSSPCVWAGGFGPVVKDGYGISYVIRDDSLGVLVTSYPPHRDGKEFIDALKLTFDEILRILHKRN